jgi:hypothetical protein
MTLPNEAGSQSNCQSPFSAPQPMSLTSPTSRLTAPLTRGSELRFFRNPRRFTVNRDRFGFGPADYSMHSGSCLWRDPLPMVGVSANASPTFQS